MVTNHVTIRRFYEAVKLGEDRLSNFRAARLMFLKQFSGPYYDRERTTVGDEPINLIFNAIATIVPNLVTNFPKTKVTSDFLAYRKYAELLGLGLDFLAKKIDLRSELRRWIVDSIFCLGIMKTGIATSGDLVSFSDDVRIDAGQPYATVVDFDDFILDPACRRIEEASFIGHRIRVSRKMLLDSGKFRNDLIEKLQSAGGDVRDRREVQNITQSGANPLKVASLQDLVEIREIWVPAAGATVWMPTGKILYDEYLRIEDYAGPKEGPYTYLSITPPMPNNPMPIAPVGIWYDLHVAANQMAKKIMEQASRQKDILGYKPSAVDDAQEIVDASDGEAIKLNDPEGARMFSFGGQQQSNEAHLAQLSYWFNLASGNTDQMGGVRSDADTATQAQILESNSKIRLEDMRDAVYLGTKKIQQKLAWYLHTDPLINLPLVKRTPVPTRTVMSPNGPMVLPPKMEEEQITLTPESREGDFLDYHFEIERKSMSRVDPNQRLQKAMLFAGKILPAAAQAAMVCKQMGVKFSFPKFVINMAKDLEIEWIDEVFYDPEFQAEVLDLFEKTPTPEGSKGQSSANGMGDVMQNGQPGGVALKGFMGGSELDAGQQTTNEIMSSGQPGRLGF